MAPKSAERNFSGIRYCNVSFVSRDEGCSYFVYHHSPELNYANTGTSKNKSYDMNTVDVAVCPCEAEVEKEKETDGRRPFTQPASRYVPSLDNPPTKGARKCRRTTDNRIAAGKLQDGRYSGSASQGLSLCHRIQLQENIWLGFRAYELRWQRTTYGRAIALY
jgi:hypothetical protein